MIGLCLSVKTLYPDLTPYAIHSLSLDGGHKLYFEQSGNSDGVPVVFLHGGPGSGAKPDNRSYFDAKGYCIIIFDQRGCHRSTSDDSIGHNTTQLLLADMEAIRQQLNIDKWVLFGGSWGATLALLYAQQYPQHVSGMILRGTFLARQYDIDWFFGEHGVRRIFPDYWQEFCSVLYGYGDSDFANTLFKVIFGDDDDARLQVAKAWALWSGRVVTHSLNMPQPYELDLSDLDSVLNSVRIEMHYAHHHYFMNENQILDDIAKLPNVPTTIIHGRKDLTCLPESSWALHCALADSKLVMVEDAGHLSSEPTMVDALINATDQMLEALR